MAGNRFLPQRLSTTIILLLAGFVSQTVLGFEEFWPPQPRSDQRASLITATSSVQRELAQANALVEAKAWDEAVDGLRKLVDESPDSLVAVEDQYYLPVQRACQLRIANWPAEALAAYRSQTDAVAEAQYSKALESGSRKELERVAESYFSSSVGDDAAWKLGELALERGEYNSARSYWLSLSLALWTPDSLPWGVAMARFDLSNEIHCTKLREVISKQFREPILSKNLLVYPDTDLPLADILARLAIVSVREGSLDRARAEAFVLRTIFPRAEGKLAGRIGNLSDTVDATIKSAQSWTAPLAPPPWTTQGGDSTRGKASEALGDTQYVRWSVPLNARPTQLLAASQLQIDAPPLQNLPGPPDLPLAFATDSAVVFYDADAWRAADVNTGEPSFGEAGHLYQEASLWRDSKDGLAEEELRLQPLVGQLGGIRVQIRQGNGPILIRGGRIARNSRVARPESRVARKSELAAIHGTTLFAVIGPPSGNPPENTSEVPERLLGLDLAAEGKLQLEIPPPRGMRFTGPPVIVDERLYIPLRDLTHASRLHVACYHRTSGRPIWNTPVCSFTGNSYASAVDTLTLGDRRLFYHRAGAVVAIRTDEGRLEWARTYATARSEAPNDLSHVPHRHASTCMLGAGILAYATDNAPALVGLDPTSGRKLWENHQAYDAHELLGSRNGRLVASGSRLWFLDSLSGEVAFAWPETTNSGIVGRGRGCIAGNEVFWPTQRTLYTLSLSTGQQTRQPLPLKRLTLQRENTDGANLAALAGGLLVATRNRLALLAPPQPTKQNDAGAVEPTDEQPSLPTVF